MATRLLILIRGMQNRRQGIGLINIRRANMPSQFEPMTLGEIEQRYILATLQNFGWNKSRSAKTLGIERSTLDRKIRRYGLVQKT